MPILKDFSISTVVAGFVTVLVGFTSSGVLIFQAAQSLGASPAEIASWILAIGLGMGVTTLGLSLYYRMPIVTAWSTSGAALLIGSSSGLSLADSQQLTFNLMQFQLAQPIWTTPIFNAHSLAIAIPLFIVTMTSQNIPGAAVLRGSGYNVRLSPVIVWIGTTNAALAPFGGYALNLAAITAAICTGREAHIDPKKCYTPAISAGIFYCLIGIFGATITSLFLAFPQELILAIAGLALFGTIGNGLATALTQESEREAALITFLVTASEITLFGLGAAFWGLLAGLVALTIARLRQATLV